LLAANTHYNALMANMFASEMFLDSSYRRDSIVSNAKAINYQPRSRISPTAKLDIVWVPTDSPTSITISRGTAFTGVKDSVSYNFYVIDPVTINPVGSSYTADDVEIKEGRYLSNSFVVDTSNPIQRFTLPNAFVDTTTIAITVQTSAIDSTSVAYNEADGFVEITSTDNVFWIQEVSGFQHEIIFGDGVVGTALANGNIITVSYVVSNGDAANDISTFSAAGSIGGYVSPDVSFTTAQNALDGQEMESNASIKNLAPKLYQTQSRAVNTGDYKALLLQERSDIKSVSIWGGEDAVPPEYGKVFISVKPISTDTWSDTIKENVTTGFLSKLNMVSIRPEFVDPSLIYVKITTTVLYNPALLQTSASELQDDVETTITDHFTNNLGVFDSTLRHSNLVTEIDATDTAIRNNRTAFIIQKRFTPVANTSASYTIAFANGIAPGSISSTSFTNAGTEYSLDDDSVGNIRSFITSGGLTTYLDETQGTIDYTTGEIILDEFTLTAFVGTEMKIDASPATDDVSPLREHIVELDDSASNITITLTSEE